MFRLVLIGLLIVPAFAGDVKVKDLLEKLDFNHHIVSDIRAKVVLTQQKQGQGVKNIEVMYYRRDADDAFLIIVTAPEAEKGNGYLRMGDNFWMYRTNTRTFQHVNRDESIAGSDAHGDDFETRNLMELYEGVKDSTGKEIITEEIVRKIPTYRFEVKAKVNDVDYPKKIYWISKDYSLPVKEESYSLNGTLMQTAHYLKYTEIKKRFVPVKQLFIDEFEKGNKTIVEISGISTDKLDDNIFTKAYLENLSK